MKRGKKKESHNHNLCACSKVYTFALNTFVLTHSPHTQKQAKNLRRTTETSPYQHILYWWRSGSSVLANICIRQLAYVLLAMVAQSNQTWRQGVITTWRHVFAFSTTVYVNCCQIGAVANVYCVLNDFMPANISICQLANVFLAMVNPTFNVVMCVRFMCDCSHILYCRTFF